MSGAPRLAPQPPLSPLPPPPLTQRTAERLLAGGPSRVRRPPTARRINTRRRMVGLTKWLLPLFALLLLGSIGAWPEISRVRDNGRIAFRRLFAVEADSRMRNPHYRGVDERNRPYTLTADWATQVSPQRMDLSAPKGDLVTESGTWLMVQARQGVYIQHAGQLDLSSDVVLYREDGTMLRTETAAIDVKQGVAASNDQTHAEGPFGVLDAQGFALVDKGAVIQFHGPGRLIINGSQR